jgi:hypothetical protein
MKNIKSITYSLAFASALLFAGCGQQEINSSSDENVRLTGVAQTSGQLASGTNFTLSGTGTSFGNFGGYPSGGFPSGGFPSGGMGSFSPGNHPGFPLDGTSLLAPTNELLAIIDAENAGDFRGLFMFSKGGGTVKSYDKDGNEIKLGGFAVPASFSGFTGYSSGMPEGCSFSGGQFPKYDSSLMAAIKTIIDFGTGVTQKRDTATITRSGKIIINRSKTSSSVTETITFENYKVNNNLIEGTKTRVSTFVKTNSTMNTKTTTTVTGGKITFANGSVATWVSDNERISSVTFSSSRATFNSTGQTITTGATVVTSSSNAVVYSHVIVKDLKSDLSCKSFRFGPVSGTVETKYEGKTIVLDFGDGSCDNKKVTVTIDGITTEREIGGFSFDFSAMSKFFNFGS